MLMRATNKRLPVERAGFRRYSPQVVEEEADGEKRLSEDGRWLYVRWTRDCRMSGRRQLRTLGTIL